MGIPQHHNWGAIFCVLALAACTTLGQFSHKKPWPTYSLQNMPQTRFTCHDKILGGYYADPETQCQMFHVCVKVAGVGVQDFRFLCPNATAFDQEAQICADWGDVDCEQAVLYYGSDNFDLYRLGSGFESKRAPLAEEEEATFHLQRAETGDIRRSKETRVDQKRAEIPSYTKKSESTTRNPFYNGNSENRKSNYDQNNDFSKVTQKYEAPKKTTSNYYTTPRGNDFHSNADSKQDADDLFKGSHSSNFFSNRNNGREDDFYDSKPTTTTTTTTTTSRPYHPPNQFFNGNGPQSDFSEFNKIPEATTKRPPRGRRPIPIQNNPNSLISNPTNKPVIPTTTYATTVPDIPKSTKRLTLQSSFNAGSNFGNDPFYRPTSSSSTSTSSTTSTTTPRTSSTVQRFPFGGNDYQQNVQPTTYSPSGAFRYKTTTSKYEEINETALRGEKPGSSTFLNSQYEHQNLEIFNRVSTRKSQNTERNIQKQLSKNTTLANRNEFTDFTKNKTPSGFQIPSRTQQVQPSAAQINLGLNAQPLDPSKLNSELRNINQTQQPHRGRVPISRFNDRQQTEPQYFRTRPQETPAPFAVPQAEQQQVQKQFDIQFNGFPQKDVSRVKTGEPLPQPQKLSKPYDSGFNAFTSSQREVSRTRTEQRTGNSEQQASKPLDSSFNAFSSPQKEVSRTRTEQRTGNSEYLPQQGSKPSDAFPSPQKDVSRTRTEQRTGSGSNSEYLPKPVAASFNSYAGPHREVTRTKTEQRTGSGTSEYVPQQISKPVESSFHGYNSPQRTRTDQRTGSVTNTETQAQSQQQQVPKPFDSNFNGYNSPQREISRTRSGTTPNPGSTTNPTSSPQHSNFNGYNNSQRDINRARTGPATNTGFASGQETSQQQPPNQFQSTYNGYNSPARDISRNKPESRKGASDNRVKPDYIPTTPATIPSPTPQRGRGRVSYRTTTQHQGRSLDNYVQSTTSAVKKFSTLVPKDQYYPTTFKPTTYKKAFDQKPTKHIDPKSRGTSFSPNTTPLPGTTSQSFNTPDENDGQYHPELYDVDYSQNNSPSTKRPTPQTSPYSEPQPISNTQTTRSPQAHLQSQQQTAFQKQPQNNFQQQTQPLATPTDLSDEEELFKTAHSLNLGAASINKLRADTLKTADKTPQQSSLNFGFDRTTYQTTTPSAPLNPTTTTTWRPTTNYIATTTTVRTQSLSKKPKKSSSASKRPPHADADTSYDYAYYDTLSETPQEYSEYDVISEFRKTKNH